MRKSYLLKFITIGMIIAGMVRLIFGFTMINFFSSSITLGQTTPEIMQRAVIAIVMIMVSVLIQLIAGFIGAINWEEPTNAFHCVLWGAVSLILCLVANILQMRADYPVSIYVWVLGVAVAALYTVAALNFWIGVRISKKRSARQS